MELFPTPILVAVLLVPFIVAVGSFYFILVKPVMQYLQARENVSAGARAEAGKLNASIADRLESLDSRLADAHAAVSEQRAVARAAAGVTEAAILAEAHTQADSRISEAVLRIKAERDSAAAALKQTADTLANDIAAQVLGRSVQA